MVDTKYLRASDGTGNAVLAHVANERISGSMTLEVDSVENWPPFFIATTGTLLVSGYVDPATVTEFSGHITGGDIVIDDFAAGFTDNGNTTAEVVLLKQTTGWADGLVDNLDVEHNGDGTHSDVTADTVVTTGDVTVGDKLNIDEAEVSTGGGIFTIPTVVSTISGADGSMTPTCDSSNYHVTALGAAGTINAPTGTPRSGQGILLRIKDNGTARALTWNAIYKAYGSALPTVTTLGKTMYIPMRYNTEATKWDVFPPTKEV